MVSVADFEVSGNGSGADRAPLPAPRSRGLGPTLAAAIWALAGIVLVLAAWSAISALIGTRRLPSPQSLWPSVYTDLFANRVLEFQGGGSQGLMPHLLYTIRQTLLGCTAGAALGAALGTAMARWPRLAVFMDLPLGAMRSIPPLAAIPFMILWFGPYPEAQLGVVIFYVGLMVTVSMSTAIDNLDPLPRRLAMTLGASEGHIFRTVILPATIPEVIGGIRVAVGIAWGIEVVAELAGAPLGMGQVFSRMIAFQELGVIIVGIFWITMVAAITDALIVAVARHLTRWVPQATSTR